MAALRLKAVRWIMSGRLTRAHSILRELTDSEFHRASDLTTGTTRTRPRKFQENEEARACSRVSISTDTTSRDFPGFPP